MKYWDNLGLRAKTITLVTAIFVPMLFGMTWFITDRAYWMEVQSGVGGLMNFVDAKQQGVIRFLGQNEKLAKTLASLSERVTPEVLDAYFSDIVSTDVFKVEEHPFEDEIKSGKRHIPTLSVYHSIDLVKDGKVIASSDNSRIGKRPPQDLSAVPGYSNVYKVDGTPVLNFRASSAAGEVIVRADARMLTDIVNGEIGNLEGDMGAFYLAGVGKTFDYYITDEDNRLITESRTTPDAMLFKTGSEFPWQRTLKGGSDPNCKNGVYETNARVNTGCREAMGFYKDQNGNLMLGASMPFYDSGWTIVVEQQADEILSPLWSVRNQIILLVTGMLALLIGTVYLLFSGMLNRIFRIRDVVTEVSEGNLAIDSLDPQGNDEIGELANGINTMKDKLGSLVKHIQENSAKVGPTVEILSDTSQQVADANVAQKQSIEQISSAAVEMSANALEVANTAAQAAEHSTSATQQGHEGQQIVVQAKQKIDELAGEVDRAVEVIATLDQESNNIGSILDVIRGIAEQTNLLALNAAIEAARAGEQGRGFAVVADEVRTLASRTQQSTEEIQQMIAKLQEGTQHAVKVMENGKQRAVVSVETVENVSAAIGTILDTISQNNALTDQIAVASSQQHAAAEEISSNIAELTRTSDNTLESINHLPQSSHELACATKELIEQISRFKTA